MKLFTNRKRLTHLENKLMVAGVVKEFGKVMHRLFKTFLIFCLLNLFISKRGALKSPTMILNVSISLHDSVRFFFFLTSHSLTLC